MDRRIRPIVFGAGCGSVLSVVVVQVISGNPWWDEGGEFLWSTVLQAALFGGIAGMLIGFAVLGARANGPVPITLLLFSWGLLGGVIALLILSLPCFLIFCLSGDRSIFLLPFLFGLPVFAFGVIVGMIVAVVKWSRMRKTTPPPRRPPDNGK